MNRYSSKSQPWEYEGQCDDDEKPESWCFDENFDQWWSWVENVPLTDGEDDNESPKEADCSPSSKAVDHLEEIMHFCSEVRVGENEDADQKHIQSEGDGPYRNLIAL